MMAGQWLFRRLLFSRCAVEQRGLFGSSYEYYAHADVYVYCRTSK